MTWTETHDFWWLIPLLMMFLCVFMCFSRRRTRMAGCCWGWGGVRSSRRGRRADDRHEGRGGGEPQVSGEAAPGDETLNSTLERLEQRLCSLEEGARAKALGGGQHTSHL